MDEERSDSDSSADTDEHSIETSFVEEPFAAPTPCRVTDGGWEFVAQKQYDPSDRHDLTAVIISAIAEAEDVSILDVKHPPLYEVVDVAGIEGALFGRPESDGSGAKSSIEFTYNQYKVSVEADGWVTVFSEAPNSTADEG